MDLNIKTIDEYISSKSKGIQSTLKKIRALIKKECPDAEESISYGMPAFKLEKKPLAYFAGYDSHIGFYPTSSPISQFKKELAKYSFGKGTVRFELDDIDYALIKKMVKFRANEISKK